MEEGMGTEQFVIDVVDICHASEEAMKEKAPGTASGQFLDSVAGSSRLQLEQLQVEGS